MQRDERQGDRKKKKTEILKLVKNLRKIERHWQLLERQTDRKRVSQKDRKKDIEK